MAAAPCKDCGRRPKLPGRHRCIVCATRIAPIGEQIAERDRRLAMVPLELRVKRVKPELWPPGERWCAGCQSFRELRDFGKKATRCKACQSVASHGAMIAKSYGLTVLDYDALLKLQGGKCAICRARPVSKRLAVDHDHKSGAVRGLLCSRCNHDLLGAGWDSPALLLAAWWYLMTPPSSGAWRLPELGLVAPGDAVRPSKASGIVDDLADPSGTKRAQPGAEPATVRDFRGVLPDEWREYPPAALNALMLELRALLRRVDPAPF